MTSKGIRNTKPQSTWKQSKLGKKGGEGTGPTQDMSKFDLFGEIKPKKDEPPKVEKRLTEKEKKLQ